MLKHVLILMMSIAFSSNATEKESDDIVPQACYTYWRTVNNGISTIEQARTFCPDRCAIIGAYWNGAWRSIDANSARCGCTLCS